MKQLRKALESPKGKEPIKVNKTLKPVKKGDPYNAEIERGEFVLGNFSHDGIPETYTAGGNKHYDGGTKVNMPDNTFVFSDHNSMKITDGDIQKTFNKPEKKSGYTPADLAKQYNINKYRKILAEENSDKLQRSTAESMIKNYNEKLGMLALVQESKKGFDAGIPFVSIPYLESMGIDPAQFVSGGDNESAEVPTSSEEEIQKKKKGGQIRVRITEVPKSFMQKGGNPKKQQPAYNTAFYNDLSKKLGYKDTTVLLPPTLKDQEMMVDDMQPAVFGENNTFGRKDWTSAELFPDFRNRNKWYFQQHSNFNPRNADEVTDFQNAYNEKAKAMGLSPYFTQPVAGKRSKYDVDSKFGEVTYSVPDLETKPYSDKPAPAPGPPSNGRTPGDIQRNDIPIIPKADENTPFWTEDIVNTAGAFGDLQRIKKYMPWQAGFDTVLPDPTFFDPTRELAANAEQSAIATQALSSYAGPQALSARISSVQGQGLTNAANILGKYNNMNVGIANQTEAARVGIINQANVQKAELATNLYDKTVLTNQNFDNAKMMARQNLRQSFVNSWTNRGKTQEMNSMNQDYRIDPKTGYVEFKKGARPKLTPAQQRQDATQVYLDILSSLKGTENPQEAASTIFKNLYGIKQ